MDEGILKAGDIVAFQRGSRNNCVGKVNHIFDIGGLPGRIADVTVPGKEINVCVQTNISMLEYANEAQRQQYFKEVLQYGK